MYREIGEPGDFTYAIGTQAPLDICKLKTLQVMDCIKSEGDIIKQIGSMTQLTRLGIDNLKEGDEKNLCVSVQKLKLLQRLSLRVSDEEEFLNLEAITLAGKLRKVPHWFHSLQNISRLTMYWSRLSEDPLPHMETLPCLTELQLINAYVGKGFYFRGGFVKLKRLVLGNFSQMNEIVIGEGVMSDLQYLMLYNFKELKALPHGTENLTKLKEMYLFVSKELVECIQEVKHIAVVKLAHQTTNDLCVENLYEF